MAARRRWFRVVALTLGLLAALLVVEIAIRVWFARSFRGGIEKLTSELPIDPETVLTLDQLLCADPDPQIVFRLKPGLRGIYRRAPISISMQGFRDDPIDPVKPDGAPRVAGLGDSSMFGWGARRGELYLDLLEAALGVEVINAAVPGYTAVQEVALFHDTVLALQPDLALIQYDLNDAHLPEFLLKPNFLAADRFFLGFIPQWLNGTLAHPDGAFMRYQQAKSDDRYRRLAGWEPLAAAYRSLRDTCRGRGIALLAVIPPLDPVEGGAESDRDPRYDPFRALCAQLEIRVIDTLPRVNSHAREHDLTPRDFLVDAKDRHPNRLGHALIAQALIGPVAESLGIQAVGEITLPEASPAPLPAHEALEQQGLYAPETWHNGTEVSWTGPAARLKMQTRGRRLWVRYLLGPPDVSARQALEVRFAINGGPPRAIRHEAPGYYEIVLDLEAEGDATVELTITVDRVFSESAGGRQLGIALYPFIFE